tara:strand:- start:1192 stop:1719 length:528 start_codon:yes stop_codon:yes gene_type:complete
MYEIKLAQILFYQGLYDDSDIALNQILKKLKMDHPLSNDIMEAIAILIGFKHNQDDFIIFSKAQLNIQQNKRTEALDKLTNLFNSTEIYIADMAKYQYAWLTYLQNDVENTNNQLNEITNETIFKELAHIFKSEIHDYVNNNKNEAIESYLLFLELYPNSIYYDDIRLRLREIAS